MSAFDRIIGYEDVKAELMCFCDVLKNYERYEKLGVSMPRGILLSGDPGIGKTMMANCFIEESGCKCFLVRKDMPKGDFVKEIRNTFNKAKEETSAIVFLDDMDKFANEDRNHLDAEEYVTVQSCIDDCRNTRVFVLATVNDIGCLPDSLTRVGRFDKSIEMVCPKGADAAKIIGYYLKQKCTLGNIDVDEISRLMEGHSCAELEIVINEAGIYAGFDKREKIEQEDIVRACMRMIFDAPEKLDSYSAKHIRSIAIHEAGHAVVSEVLEPGSVSLVSVCSYSAAKEGVTIVHRSDEIEFSMRANEHVVMRKLGGKAATEMVLGLVDVGCSMDLWNAHEIVSEFVRDCCSCGFEALSCEGLTCSDFVREKTDRLVAAELEKFYLEAKRIIAENRQFLDKMISELVEKKTLTYRDIEAIRTNMHK